MSLVELVSSFNADLIPLKHHLFIAYNQWSASKAMFANLKVGEVATQEDYQQNQQMIMADSTTSSHMGPISASLPSTQ